MEVKNSNSLEIKEKTDSPLKIQIFLRVLLYILGIIIIVTIALAWWKYPETYEFFQENVSNLGGNLSDQGYDNSTSSLIMMIGFSVIAAIIFAISIIYFVTRRLRFNYVKAILCLALAAGAAGIAVPLDHATLNEFHYIGAALFMIIFGAFNFVSQGLRYYRKHKFFPEKKNVDFWIDFVFIWIVFFAFVFYFVIFLLEYYTPTPLIPSPPVQKAVLIVDLIAIALFNINDM